MKKGFLVMAVAVLASCTPGKQEGNRYENFPETRQLMAETMPLDTALFRYPFRVRLQEDKMAVLDLHGADCFLHVFSYPDMHYLASGGRHGEAPTEMLSSENIRWGDDGLWTLDANKIEMTCWNFSVNGDSLVQRERVKLDENVLRPLDFVQYDDTTFIIPDYSGDSRLCRVNRQGKLLGTWGQIPSSDEDAVQNARPALSQAWRSFIDYNPDNGVLAAVTQLGEVLEIWNLKDSTHVLCIGPHGEPQFQVAEGYGIPTGIMGFGDVHVGKDAIYAVFSGQSFREMMQSAQQGTELPDGGKYVYVFSLDGKPLCKYELDHYISGLCVDEPNRLFIAADVNKDEPMVRFRY